MEKESDVRRRNTLARPQPPCSDLPPSGSAPSWLFCLPRDRASDKYHGCDLWLARVTTMVGIYFSLSCSSHPVLFYHPNC